MKQLLFLLAAVLSYSASVDDDDAGTSSTGALLMVNFASGTQPIEAVPARFGIPNYNGDAKGKLESLERWDLDHGVDADSAGMGCQPYSAELKNDWKNRFEKPIALVKRGICKFVVKVQNAQEAGASAVVVIDIDEKANVMSPPDGFNHGDVFIPAVMISHSDGEAIRTSLNTEVVTVSIEWHVPIKDGKVELELYTASNDAEDMAFKRNFRNIARILNQDDKFIFRPVYMIEDGDWWGCGGSESQDPNDPTPILPCGDQCANYGQYCAVDPDEDLFSGISGYDVIEENVRQLCLWNWTQAEKERDTGIEEEDVWWEYVAQFDDNCLKTISDSDQHKLHEKCSIAQMDNTVTNMELKNSDGSRRNLWAELSDCLTKTGTIDTYEQGNNALLDQAIAERRDKHITLLPSFAINGRELQGSWDCPELPSAENCNVFKALCAAFLAEQKPTLCFNDPGCPAGKFRDSCGECSCEPINQEGEPQFEGSCARDSTAECSDYMNDENTASQASVVAIGVVIALVTMFLAVSLFYLWKKNDENSKVIQETKQYLSLDDDYMGSAAPVQVLHSGINSGHSQFERKAPELATMDPELADNIATNTQI